MNLEIMIGAGQVKAIARVLDAEARGAGYTLEDCDIRDRVLSLIVGKASLILGLDTPEIRAVVQRDYDRFHARERRPTRQTKSRSRTRSKS